MPQSWERNLATAVHENDKDKVKRILGGSDKESRRKDLGKNLWRGMRYETPIHFAAWLGHDDILG